ncbi:biosynthetic peptidoglycan transglycosylase [Fluviispira sanaruensis]|uniref:Monofunctional biosynthetic peptidoglycan transglycosylase n=1 Tax=Fluviispira sanaruensis TaxID=2493639 RepID=A0A4P2VGK5_FLUSA|nr:biosynthetic peptidoglycan transglycosylase [Fluviispira sanaruensis]BBH52013.1 monofunctional biosynthetic peptidoglycan transglycosylase [Fluviispira sanaruensis]
MKVFSTSFWFIKLPLFCFVAFILWFIPWVFLLYSGLLIYFPYESDGKSRYIRITGPVVSVFSPQSWSSYNEIPKTCKAALIAAEDNRFYQHKGVDFESLKMSFITNQKIGKKKRGGSTITQQLVKNAFLSRKKSYLRKSREIMGAFILDGIMLKDQQLEWYFNVVEFGPKIYGLENAAQKYFNTEAKRLTPSQCIALVAIIPSPKKWNQSLVTQKPTSFFVQRYKKILNTIQKMGILNNKDLVIARNYEAIKGKEQLDNALLNKTKLPDNTIKTIEGVEDFDENDEDENSEDY